ncbi:MAG: peptidoglycan DD-metalloendopeptidase family protein [Clostridia bacterium]|nr:peptidoglycan DD-metalloendopeptidase family protein [Clostridia bacterium]
MNEKIGNVFAVLKDKTVSFASRTAESLSGHSGVITEKISHMTKRQRIIACAAAAGVIAAAVIAFALGAGSAPAAGDAEKNAVDAPDWVISIGGKDVVTVGSEKEAWEVFEGLKKYYVTDGSQVIDIAFSDEISFKEAEGNNGEENAASENVPNMSVEEAISYIVTGSKEPITYVVKGGDTLWDIATANGLSPYELQDMNPGFTPETMQIGQVVNLYAIKPFVTVQTTEVIKSTELIPYETTFENTSKLYKGQTSVKSAGQNGSKEVEAQVVKNNGYIVASTVLSEQILSQPVTQVSYQGTANAPASASKAKSSSYSGPVTAGTGSLGSPVSHIEISSGYGANRGSRRHLGVDLRNPSGTPIYAADTGTVIFAGYSGSYGNIVKISHGNGIETRYAHCASMYVKAGDTVAKGQTIATVGKTGNATGYVLHYEVLINGANVNPANYL